jgi:hypothetical protein
MARTEPAADGAHEAQDGQDDLLLPPQDALQALQSEGYAGRGEVTVLSDGAEIMKWLPEALPEPGRSIKRRGGLLRLTVG